MSFERGRGATGVQHAAGAADAGRDPAPAAPDDPADRRWGAALRAVVRDPARMGLHFQPIVELDQGSVAGYEALARFTGDVTAPPDRWFAAAEHWGVNAVLQARVVTQAVATVPVLPPDTFLTVNVDPHLLTDPLLQEALLGSPRLDRLVVELTEHTLSEDAAGGAAVLAELRRRGALIAMDDAGTGYAGLSQLLALRPHIVKLDRALITGVDADPVKSALVETLGDLVSRMDAWVLAEGIETEAELETLGRLGVALGQGYVLARPAPQMPAEVPAAVARAVRATSARSSLDEHAASLVRAATAGIDPAVVDVLLGEDGRPRAVRRAALAGDPGGWAPAVVVAPSASLPEVARRAAARPAADVAAPLVCTDGQGRVVGVITHSDLLVALARSR